MKTPTKVTVTVTADGYTTTVYAGKKVLSRRTMLLESSGSARGTRPGDVSQDLKGEQFTELVDSLDDLDGFDVARALRELQ